MLERFTPTEDMESLAEFLESLRDSMQYTLTELMAEHHGLELSVGVDVQYRHMLEVLVATSHLTTPTAVLHNDL